MKATLWGGIEAGGTHFVCAVGTAPDDVHAEIRFATTTPEVTLARTINFFQPYTRTGRLRALGIGSFGPIDLRPSSATYGYILNTPKPDWAHIDFVGPISHKLQIPVVFETDVNAAAYGEYCWGAARGLENVIYLTIGTGIGGGGIVFQQPLHGFLHPEMGHILLPHDTHTDPYPGCCPFHGDCFEGLASGTALSDRWGIQADVLPDDHRAWQLEAHYIGLAMVNYICMLSPQKIILSGGVMNREFLLPLVRRKVSVLLNGYLPISEIGDSLESFIVPPLLGKRAGVLGALALAQMGNS